MFLNGHFRVFWSACPVPRNKDSKGRPRSFLFLLGCVNDGVQCWNVLQFGCRAFESPNVGIDILRLLVGQSSTTEARHGSRGSKRRHVRPSPEECQKALLGREVSPTSYEGSRSGFPVVAVAGIAAVSGVQRLPSGGVSGNRTGRGWDVGNWRVTAASATLSVQYRDCHRQRDERHHHTVFLHG